MKFVMERFGFEEDIDVIGKLHGKVFKGRFQLFLSIIRGSLIQS
jgi:hypothetical protein